MKPQFPRPNRNHHSVKLSTRNLVCRCRLFFFSCNFTVFFMHVIVKTHRSAAVSYRFSRFSFCFSNPPRRLVYTYEKKQSRNSPSLDCDTSRTSESWRSPRSCTRTRGVTCLLTRRKNDENMYARLVFSPSSATAARIRRVRNRGVMIITLLRRRHVVWRRTVVSSDDYGNGNIPPDTIFRL